MVTFMGSQPMGPTANLARAQIGDREYFQSRRFRHVPFSLYAQPAWPVLYIEPHFVGEQRPNIEILFNGTDNDDMEDIFAAAADTDKGEDIVDTSSYEDIVAAYTAYTDGDMEDIVAADTPSDEDIIAA